MKKNIIFILFLFLSFFIGSCFLTTSGYIKQNNGRIFIVNEIPISISVIENSFIDREKLENYIKNYFSNTNRIPQFIVKDYRREKDLLLDVYIEDLDFDSQIIDKTTEKQNEEKENYKKRVKEYEEEKRIAEEFKKEPPKELEPLDEETISYKIQQFSLNCVLQIVLRDVSIDYTEDINSTVFREIIIEHKIRKIKQNAIFSFTPTGNVFSDVTANIVTGFLNFLFSPQKEIDKKENQNENEILNDLRKSLFSDISQKILSSVDPYFIKYGRDNIYLLPINTEIDGKIREILHDKENFLTIFDFMKSLLPNYKDDTKARIYLNLSILYFYHKDDKMANYFYDLGSEEKFTYNTANIFNSILPHLGKDYLKFSE